MTHGASSLRGSGLVGTRAGEWKTSQNGALEVSGGVKGVPLRKACVGASPLNQLRIPPSWGPVKDQLAWPMLQLFVAPSR